MGISETITKNPGLRTGLLITVTFVGALLVSQLRIFQTVELKIQNQLFELRGPKRVSDSPIVLVTISQKADEEIPFKYPWPTKLYAHLIKNLNRAGAKAIAFDIIFDQQDHYNPANDTLFANALKKYGNVVLAGKIFRSNQQQAGSRSSEISKVEPLSVLKKANSNQFGVVSNLLDSDDFLRRYLLEQQFQGQKFYALGLQALRIYKGLDSVSVTEQSKQLDYGPFHIPKAGPNNMIINYYGPPGTFKRISFEQVIDDSTFTTNFEKEAFPVNSFNDPQMGLLKQGVLKDKIVLVGATMPELHDYHSTPFTGGTQANQGTMPGVEVHANAIQTILDGNYLYRMGTLSTLAIMLVLSIISVLLTRSLGSIVSFFVMLGLAVLYFGGVIYGFLDFNYILQVSAPVITIMGGYVTTTAVEYMTEQKEKRRIKSMFQSYVSPELVEQMIESGEEPELGGDEVYMTAFFSDIQSFSSFSEQMEPRKLVRLINEYLSAMTAIITQQGGTLDKYIGDAIVAFYGAPVPLEDHAYRACVTSQLMQKKLAELRNKWETEDNDWPEIVHQMQNRIGLNTGRMVTGNMGSASRFNYTMMGDDVNLAARCESGAKSFGVYTMVTEETRKEAEKFGDRCVFRYLDKIIVKGRSQPVRVYEILGLKEDITPENRECIEIFEAGTRYYQDGVWDKAIEKFEESAALEKFQPGKTPGIKTNPSQIFIERCKKLQLNPPPDDWDGVYRMTTK